MFKPHAENKQSVHAFAWPFRFVCFLHLPCLCSLSCSPVLVGLVRLWSAPLSPFRPYPCRYESMNGCPWIPSPQIPPVHLVATLARRSRREPPVPWLHRPRGAGGGFHFSGWSRRVIQENMRFTHRTGSGFVYILFKFGGGLFDDRSDARGGTVFAEPSPRYRI